jgi:HK97 family phage major capsid protein
MQLILTQDYLGHQVGTTIEIIDPTIAKSMINQGYAKASPPDPITLAINEAVAGLGLRVDHALELALQELAKAQTKSRKNGIPHILAGADRDPKKTFGAFLLAVRKGDRKTLEEMGSTFENWETKTAMDTESGAHGGFLLPTEHYDQVMMYAIESSIMRRYAMIIPMGTRETDVPCLDVVTAPTAGNNAMLGGVVFNWTEDTGTETETEPNLKQLRLINYELTGYSYLSNTLLEDARGLEAIISMIFGVGIGWTEDYAFFHGNGVGKPLGVINWAGLISVTRSGASAFAIADYAAMMARLIPTSDMKRCFWACHPTVLAKLYALTAGNILYVGTFQETPGGRKLGGLPLHVSDKLNALNTAGDILLCDGGGYVIGDRKNTSIAYSYDARFTNNQTVWRVVHRVGGRPWATDKTTLPDATSTVGPFIALAAG